MNTITSTVWVFIWATTWISGRGFEIVDQSEESSLVLRGSDLSLHCTSDVPYTFCLWKHGDIQCTAQRDGFDSSVPCQSNERIMWDLDGTKCGIVISGVSREADVGEYHCKLINADGGELMIAKATMQVDVAVPSVVSFGGKFEPEEVVSVNSGEHFIVECHSKGGFPDPIIRAALGESTDIIDEGNDVNLDEAEGAFQRQSLDDGSAHLVKYYSYMPVRDDCGKFVKCEAVQYNTDGELMFEYGSDVVSRKIMVQFPPQPLADPLPDIEFGIGQDFAQVDITFEASPAPGPNQIIWQIKPRTADDMDSIVISSSDMPSPKYEILDLDVSGHMTTASFRIFNLTELDGDFLYKMVANNGLGENKYSFNLVNILEFPSLGNDTSRIAVSTSYGDTDSAGIGGGTIIAIVVVIVVIIVALASVLWAKSKGKCCFTQKNAEAGSSVVLETTVASEEKKMMTSTE